MKPISSISSNRQPAMPPIGRNRATPTAEDEITPQIAPQERGRKRTAGDAGLPGNSHRPLGMDHTVRDRSRGALAHLQAGAVHATPAREDHNLLLADTPLTPLRQALNTPNALTDADLLAAPADLQAEAVVPFTLAHADQLLLLANTPTPLTLTGRQALNIPRETDEAENKKFTPTELKEARIDMGGVTVLQKSLAPALQRQTARFELALHTLLNKPHDLKNTLKDLQDEAKCEQELLAEHVNEIKQELQPLLNSVRQNKQSFAATARYVPKVSFDPAQDESDVVDGTPVSPPVPHPQVAPQAPANLHGGTQSMQSQNTPTP
jgi:hypothetical protein